MRLVDLPRAIRRGDRNASIGAGLDMIAAVIVRDALCAVLRPEQTWEYVDEILSFARNPHRPDDAIRKDDDPRFHGESRLSALGPRTVVEYHRRGLKIFRALGIARRSEIYGAET